MPSSDSPAPDAHEKRHARPVAGAPWDSDTRNTVLASFLGWTLDAFDFFVLVFVLSKAAETFQVTLGKMTLAITVTLALRPVGALIFGLLADRFGRRRPLMWSVLFFSVMEVASGLAPTYTSFMVCRALFGIGMGGEWGVGAALAMEKVPALRRGFVSGLLQQGYPTGYLLAAFCFRFMPETWSWRTLFFIGGLPALLVFFVRYGVKESEAWREGAKQSWSGLARIIGQNWGLCLYLIALMAAMNFASHGTQDLYPSFLEKERHFTKTQVANVAIIYNVGALLGGITFGACSDRLGRRYALAAAFALAALLIPWWTGSTTMGWQAAAAFLMQFMVQGAWGIIPAHLTELAPGAVRGFLPGFAYQCGVLIAANAAHWQVSFAKNGRYSGPMAVMALIVFAAGAVVVLCGPERRAAQFREFRATGGFKT